MFKEDSISGTVRPWGLGPRVPMYVVSPWSKGGWVNSEVFDHTSVGQFLETRFGVTIPGISPWHRAVCGDLTSLLRLRHPQRSRASRPCPTTKGSVQVVMGQIHRRPGRARRLEAQPLLQEPGIAPRAPLPYLLDVQARLDRGEGPAGARLPQPRQGRSGVPRL